MNLRELAREYANGILGIHAYRKARDELIESILAGDTKLVAHDFQAPLNLQRVEAAPDFTSIQARPVKKPAPSPAPSVTATIKVENREHASWAHRGMLILVGFAAIIVLLVILVIIVALYPYTHQKKSAPDGAGQEITAPGPASQPGMEHADALPAGANLIKQFLRKNDWTDESLQQFTSVWQGFSAEERNAGLTSAARTELANAIYRKLQEERIMLELGDVKSSIDKQTILVTFAQQVGINDPRIVVKDTP